jgi:predicted esterase
VVNTPIGARAVEALPSFAPLAANAGWVVVAADGALPAKLETTEWCYAMLAAALDHLARSWPGVKRWPVAAAGHSGGAKRAPYIAAALMERGTSVIGLYLSGCNEDRATDALRWHKPGPGFLKVPIFLSSGARDTIATPADHERVAAEMAAHGFTTIRCERHDQGHVVNDSHLSIALRWFREPHRAGVGL